jgi:hypothetical protein
MIEVSSLYGTQQSKCLLAFHMTMETDEISETLRYLEYGTLDNDPKLSNSECYTPGSEYFRTE